MDGFLGAVNNDREPFSNQYQTHDLCPANLCPNSEYGRMDLSGCWQHSIERTPSSRKLDSLTHFQGSPRMVSTITVQFHRILLGKGIRDRCMNAANRVLRQIHDDLNESIIPVPPLRFRSRDANINWEPVGVPEAIPRSGSFVASRCVRILDRALKSRDFTADSEMLNVFAIWATEACS
jgi:hypothetical protein